MMPRAHVFIQTHSYCAAAGRACRVRPLNRDETEKTRHQQTDSAKLKPTRPLVGRRRAAVAAAAREQRAACRALRRARTCLLAAVASRANGAVARRAAAPARGPHRRARRRRVGGLGAVRQLGEPEQPISGAWSALSVTRDADTLRFWRLARLRVVCRLRASAPEPPARAAARPAFAGSASRQAVRMRGNAPRPALRGYIV
jgi:hypothetical protein